MKHFSSVPECSRKGQEMTKGFLIRSLRTTAPFPRLGLKGLGLAGGQAGVSGKENTAVVLCTLFSSYLLRRLWVTTPPPACRDDLTGPPFGPLPRIHPGWNRKKVERRGCTGRDFCRGRKLGLGEL